MVLSAESVQESQSVTVPIIAPNRSGPFQMIEVVLMTAIVAQWPKRQLETTFPISLYAD